MKSLKGHLLIAAPSLLDPNFFRTVVLMIQHNEEGAMGLVLNRPTNMTISQAWEQVSDDPCEREDAMFHGGPCQGPLMVVHDEEAASQIEVCDGVHFTTETDQITWLIKQDDGDTKFFVGYAGWGAGQLESELQTGSWLTIPASAEQVFSQDGDLWQQVTRAIERSAIYQALNIRHAPQDPSVN